MEVVEPFVTRAGRRVGVHQLRDRASGRTVIFCHPAPGAGNLDPDPAETERREVTLVGVDRPGYGESDRVGEGEWSTVDGAAADIAQVLAARSIEPVGVVGWSAGGRVALALAARHPDLVDRVVLVATPAPDEEVPWVPPDYRAALEGMRGMAPADVHVALGAQLAAMIPPDPASDAALDLLGRSRADDAALASPGARERLGSMLGVAFAQGAAGMAADIAGYSQRPWGFEPSDVEAKVLLLYGTADPAIGSRHATWWQRHLPSARVEMAPGAGHLLIVPMWHRVLSFLAPKGRR